MRNFRKSNKTKMKIGGIPPQLITPRSYVSRASSNNYSSRNNQQTIIQNDPYKFYGEKVWRSEDFSKYYDPIKYGYIIIGKDNKSAYNGYPEANDIYQGNKIYPPLLESQRWPPEIIDKFKSNDGKFYLKIINEGRISKPREDRDIGPVVTVDFIKLQMNEKNEPVKDRGCLMSKCYIIAEQIFKKKFGEFKQEELYYNTQTENPDSKDFYKNTPSPPPASVTAPVTAPLTAPNNPIEKINEPSIINNIGGKHKKRYHNRITTKIRRRISRSTQKKTRSSRR